MSEKDTTCPFCNIRAPMLEDEFAFVIYDRDPVNPGQVLILPKRHIESFFDASSQELMAMFTLLADVTVAMSVADPVGALGR